MSSDLITDKRSYSYGVNNCVSWSNPTQKMFDTIEIDNVVGKLDDVYECADMCDNTKKCSGFYHNIDNGVCILRMSDTMLACNVGAENGFQYYAKQ